MDNSSNKRHLAFTLRFNGRTNALVISVKISLPYNPEIDQNKEPPIPIECRAIWDTGATNSVITKALVQKAGLIPSGKEKVTNTSIVELRNKFFINLLLPNKVILPYLKVTECEDVLGNGNIDMLIGMDVIGVGDFATTHENGKTVMSFIVPPISTIDYVPISESENRKQETIENFESQKKTAFISPIAQKGPES